MVKLKTFCAAAILAGLLWCSGGALADALWRLIEAHISLDGASDHGVSEALYLRDPDGNGVELYRDRPEHEWPRTPDGRLAMHTRRLDLRTLLDTPLPEDPGPVRDLA